MPLGDFRSVFLPYCLKRQPDGRYAVLNREYKPVGFYTKTWVDYEKHPVLVKFKGITKIKAAKLSYKGDGSLDEIYLYNDGCIPTRNAENMNAYLLKLEILANLKIDGVVK
jgi:hypothetical protein